ncbi:MAG: class I SAM-dependent methyltransferase [Thiocapsa sp.]|nr:class I SAM-dependent methyltransferase [Thiocapsa sp.]MCG6986433.1 class I SAM-dependent methyltransferase [Thiocapsa sp.]
MKDGFDLLSAIDDSQWLELILHNPNQPIPEGAFIPKLPPDSVQLAFNGSAGVSNLRSGFAIYQQIKAAINAWGSRFTPESHVLDFGCGWGRVIRFFAKDVRAENLFGVDIAPMGIETCNSTLRGNFRLISRSPPLDFPDGSLDVIYAWSVFSHLPEALHIDWLNEFSRLVRPGGLLIVSTLPRSFIHESKRLKAEGMFNHPWQRAAAESFDDFDVALAAYDQGHFVFSPKPQEEYGMALIPQAYVQKHWKQYFDLCEFIAHPPGLAQSLIVSRKLK